MKSPQNGRKFASYSSNRELISKMSKELKTLNMNSPVNMWGNQLASSQKKCKWPINTFKNVQGP
jgi:hypothetical protein